MEDVNGYRPFLPPNYVSLAQLEERWLKEKEKKRREEEGTESKGRGKSSEQFGTSEGTKPASMEDVNGNRPVLPPNYVSLAQLEERWLKEKEKKRRGEEGTGSKGRRRSSEQYGTSEGTKPSSPSENKEKDVAVVADQDRKPDELKKKKKWSSRMNREGRNPRNEEIEAVVADQEQDERKPHESNKEEKKRSRMNREGRKPRNEEIEAVVADQEQDEQKPHESNKEEKKRSRMNREGRKPRKEEIEAVVADQKQDEQKPHESNKEEKKRSRMFREGRKPRNEEIEAVVGDQEQDETKPHESNEEKKEVNKWSRKIVKPRDEENEGPGNGNQSRRRNNLRRSVKDQTVLVSQSLENLSLNAWGDRWRRNVSGRFGTGGGNLVWVRKGEIETTDTVPVPK